MAEQSRVFRKFTVIGAVLVLAFALYPQILSWASGDTNGVYFASNYDELAYSAYVNSIIDGAPRKFDPFLQAPTENESLYSIQMVPAYAIAWPARLLGLSTSTVFILLIGLAAIFAYLSIYWLIREVTGTRPELAAAFAVGVLALGTAAALQGELRHLLTGSVLVDFLPFLRRYQPAVAFPLFFVFCLSVWRSINPREKSRDLLWPVCAGVIFAILVFSYFYLWTAALAWLFIFAALSALLDREARVRVAVSVAVIAGIGLIALVPYFLMLGERSGDLDAVQLLTRSRMPTILSPTMLIGVAIAVMFLLRRKGRGIPLNDGPSIFGLSMALTPVALMNQQVITGLSLQPVHYEIFIANYLVLLGGAVLLVRSLRDLPILENSGAKIAAYVMAGAAIWGFVEVASSASRASAAALVRDRSMPALSYIRQQPDAEHAAVSTTNFVTADLIPTAGPFRPLWNAHSSSAGSISPEENKRLFHLFLYFAGFEPKDLSQALTTNVFEVTAAVFGSERALPSLGSSASAITAADIAAETKIYTDFISKTDAGGGIPQPVLSYIVVPADGEQNFRNVDRWYRRDEGHQAGLFVVYKLSPKQ